MKCPRCGESIPTGAKSCTRCGARLAAGMYCPHCQAVIPKTAKTCPKCGKPIPGPGAPQSASLKKPLTKRWWFWAACLLLTLGILGNLGNAISGKSGSAGKSPSAASPSPKQENSNNFLSLPVQEGDVMNGTQTEKIGTWAYIEMDKAAAKAASPEDYAAFAGQTVSGSKYKWFSIIFPDHTGIHFPGCHVYLATYGQVDQEGCITEPIGDISLSTKTGKAVYQARESPSALESAEESTEQAPLQTAEPGPDESSAPPPSSAPESAPQENPPAPAAKPEATPAPTQKPAEIALPGKPEEQPKEEPKAPSHEGGTIYITKSGKRYHYDNQCNGGTYYESTLEEALGRGLTPCNKCVQ